MTEVAIIGIGMHRFGRTEGVSGLEQGVRAVNESLKDAGCRWTDIQFAFGGSQDAGNADSLIGRLGPTGLQFMNVANGCATGGSALLSAYQAIKSGAAELGLAVGFDKHERGAFRIDPADWGLGDWYGETGFALTTQFFALKIQRYMALHGITEGSLVRVAQKAYANGARNELAWRREAWSYEQIANSPMLSDPLRKLMFCSPSEGAAAIVLCSSNVAARYTSRPVIVRAATMRTRGPGSFEVFNPSITLKEGSGATAIASRAAYEMAGVGPEDIDIAQIQDTESGAEIMHMAENGFCKDGEQERMLLDGETTLSGSFPINTDGGCLANGEPVGASGLRQVCENVKQIRGAAGAHQVSRLPKLAYTHVYGAPGISAVTILGT